MVAMLRFCQIYIAFFILRIDFAVGAIDLSHTDNSQHGSAVYLDSRQAPGVASSQSFVRRAWHASAVAGSYIYIEGGEFSYQSGYVITEQYSSSTLSIDLSQDWRNDSVVLHAFSKPRGAPMLSMPAFAYDEKNDIFYSGFAGRKSSFDNARGLPTICLWSFKPDGAGSGIWKEEIGNRDPVFDHLTLSTKGYQAYGGGAALSLGGVSRLGTPDDTEPPEDEVKLPGLLQLNVTAKIFTNSSANSFNAEQTGLYGQMHYVPSFGPNGLFAIMGGSTFPDTTQENLIGFENIWIYEPVMEEWFIQTATGNIPEGRKEFCTAGVSSTNGTYEIFLYGGFDGNLGLDAVPYDEIFILTLPAFHWIKVDYRSQYPRNGHTCNAVGGSQIISIGGVDSNSHLPAGFVIADTIRSTFNSSVDPFTQGLAIFDMTTLTWADRYTAHAPPYEQSIPVKAFYNENPQNGSQFTDKRLQPLFQPTNSSPEAPSTTINPSSTRTPTPSATLSTTPTAAFTASATPSAPKSHTNKIAIVGSTIGGVVGLALSVSLSYSFYRRRHKSHPQPNRGSDIPELQGNRHPRQEVHGNSRPNELNGNARAEMGKRDTRQEMGYHEATGVERWPYELEANEIRP